jgi:hypothetical protein
LIDLLKKWRYWLATLPHGGAIYAKSDPPIGGSPQPEAAPRLAAIKALSAKRQRLLLRLTREEGVEMSAPRFQCLTLLGVVGVAGVDLRGRVTAECVYLYRPLGICVGSLYRGFVSNA